MKKATIAGLSTAAITVPGLSDPVTDQKTKKKPGKVASDSIRTGFIGVGNRGQGHLRTCLGMGKADIVAICDVSERSLSDAKKLISAANVPEPGVYTGNEFAYLALPLRIFARPEGS